MSDGGWVAVSPTTLMGAIAALRMAADWRRHENPDDDEACVWDEIAARLEHAFGRESERSRVHGWKVTVERETAGEWKPSRWWRVIRSGSVWCETSDEQEARAAVRPGDSLQRQWQRTEEQWLAVPGVIP